MFDRIIPLLIICLSSMFFGKIDPLFKVALVILLIYTLYDRKLSFDVGDIFLALGTSTYHLFTGSGIDEAIYYSVVYAVIYQLGKKITTVGGYSPERKAGWASVVMGFAMMIKGWLHYSVRPEGATDEWIGWGQTEPGPRTHFEMYLVIMAALMGYFIVLIIRSGIALGVIGVIMSLVCAYLGIVSEGRFAPGCCLCGTLAVLGLYFVDNRLYKKTYGKIIIAAFLGAVVMLPVVYMFDLFGYRTMFDNSYMSGSGGFFTNTRFSLMLQQIKLFRDYPLGNCDAPLVEYNGVITYYAHNFWIDIGRNGGIIPALLYVAFSVTNIISMIKVSLYSKDISKYSTIAAFIGLMLLFFLQPTIYFRTFWCAIILMGGLFKGISDAPRDKGNDMEAVVQISFSL